MRKFYSGNDGVARRVKKIYLGKSDSVSYTELSYIESNGIQYIDTGVKPNQDTRIDIVAQFVSGSNSTQCIAGCQNGSNENFWIFWTKYYMQFVARYNTSLNLSIKLTDNSNDTEEFDTKHTFSLNKNVFTIDDITVTGATGTFQSENTLTLFAVNNNGAKQSYATAKIFSCKIYDNDVIIRDFVPCKVNGFTGLFDRINGVFYENSGTGSFTEGETVGEVSTSNAFARKVKKAYIGVGGVAKLFFGNFLKKHESLLGLNDLSSLLSAVKVGNYALFGGGTSRKVTAVSNALTISSPASFDEITKSPAAAAAGNMAYFFGGKSSSNNPMSFVECYDETLTENENIPLLTKGRCGHTAVTLGNYALTGGGYNSFTDEYMTLVEVYNSDGTKNAVTPHLSSGRMNLSATAIDNLAVFSGVSGDIFDDTLTLLKTFDMNISGSSSAVTLKNYGLFLNGTEMLVVTKEGSVISSLTLSTGTYKGQKGTVLGDYALFSGAVNDNYAYSAKTWVFDDTLTEVSIDNLSEARSSLAAVTVGNYALFGGGESLSNGDSDRIDIYTID